MKDPTFKLSEVTDAMGEAWGKLSVKERATADRELRIYTEHVVDILKGKENKNATH